MQGQWMCQKGLTLPGPPGIAQGLTNMVRAGMRSLKKGKKSFTSATSGVWRGLCDKDVSA